MRLLHFNALGKLSLTDFRGKLIPPYAILSHRWSDSEILIEDIYLLVVPSSESAYDAEEEERRMQAAKAERLQNAELLHMQGQAEQGVGGCRSQYRVY